jgi:hypothetical protein
MPNVADYVATLSLKSNKPTFDMGNKDLERTEKNLRRMGENARQNTPRFDQFTKGIKIFSAGVSKGQSATQSLTGALGSLEVGTMGVLGVTGLAIGAFAAVEAGAFAMAAATGKANQSLIVQAASTGLGIESLMKWHRAAQLIGMDSTAMDSTFSSMRSQSAMFKTWGELSQDQLKAVAMLGEEQGGGRGFADKWLGMNPEQKVRAVFQVAQGMKDVNKAALLVNQTLGGAGESLFWSLDSRSQSLEKLLAESSSLGMVRTGEVKRSAAFGDEMSEMGAILKEFKTLLGSELARNFMGPLKEFIEWYKENKDGVRSTAEAISDSLGAPIILASKGYGGYVDWLAENAKSRSNESPWMYDESLKQFRHKQGSGYVEIDPSFFKNGLSREQILESLNNKGNAIDMWAVTGNVKDRPEAYGDRYYLNGAEIRLEKQEADVLQGIFRDKSWLSTSKAGVKK